MDARKCIAYLTIELRGSIPEEFREQIGWHVYGCDLCQDVCPYNRKSPVTALQEFQPRGLDSSQSLLQPNLEWLLSMDEDEFRTVFRHSSIKRAKWAGLIRNACIALGNAKDNIHSTDRPRIVEALKKSASSENLTIAESAQWALDRIEQGCK